jgi:hypothetical protein
MPQHEPLQRGGLAVTLRADMSIAAGVRYRFANGVRDAMRLWGAVIVAYAVAAGLEAEPPLVRWAHHWMTTPLPRRLLTDLAITIGFGLFVRPVIGAWGEEQRDVLPLSAMRRFAIDWASVALYLTPPLIALVAICLAGGTHSLKLIEPVAAIALASAIGVLRPHRERMRSDARAIRTRGGPHELRWLFRASNNAIGGSVAFATLIAAGALLALQNNHVVRPLSILRIECAFLGFAAATLAGAVVRARDRARPYRVLHSVVPIASAARMRTLLLTSSVLLVPSLAVVAFARFSPVPLVYAAVVFAIALLAAERQSLHEKKGDSLAVALAYVAAVAGAVDGRIALAVGIVLLPFVWRAAVYADATCDLRVTRTEVIA